MSICASPGLEHEVDLGRRCRQRRTIGGGWAGLEDPLLGDPAGELVQALDPGWGVHRRVAREAALEANAVDDARRDVGVVALGEQVLGAVEGDGHQAAQAVDALKGMGMRMVGDARTPRPLDDRHPHSPAGLLRAHELEGDLAEGAMPRPLAGAQEIRGLTPGELMVGGVEGRLGIGLVVHVAHREARLGLPELFKRGRRGVDRRVGRSVIGAPAEVEEAIPAGGHDRAHEHAAVLERAIGMAHAVGHAGEVAGAQDPALIAGPDLDSAANAEEDVVLALVEVLRDRPRRGRAGQRHHRHRAAGFLGARQRAADLAEEQVRPAAPRLEHVGHAFARQREEPGSGVLDRHLVSLRNSAHIAELDA